MARCTHPVWPSVMRPGTQLFVCLHGGPQCGLARPGRAEGGVSTSEHGPNPQGNREAEFAAVDPAARTRRQWA